MDVDCSGNVIVNLFCNRRECQGEGINWTARGSVMPGEVVLDDPVNWLCPVCGEVGVIREIRDSDYSATVTVMEILDPPVSDWYGQEWDYGV